MPLTVASVTGQGLAAFSLIRGENSFSLDPSGAAPELILVPGFVDIHCHGAFGIDFMTASSDQMAELADRLAALGYEAFLPTTVTSSPESIAKAIASLPEHPIIAGFHLEGPFISPAYPGAQPKEYIAPAEDLSAWEAILSSRKLRIVTLAPEIAGADNLIRHLSARGVIISLGHSNATFEQAAHATQCGATQITHTFNAMRGIHHRELGLAGFALLGNVDTELIYDRLHVSRPAAELLLRSKSPQQILAVSDSSMATGLTEGNEIQMWGYSCLVGRGDVRLTDGTLAGSAVTLDQVFVNLLQDFGPEIAIRACCLNPRRALGLKSPSVWMLFTFDGTLKEIWWAQLDSN